MVGASPSSAEYSPGWTEEKIGRQEVELVPSREPGQHSPPLTWECDRIPGTPHHHTLGHPHDRIGDCVPHT